MKTVIICDENTECDIPESPATVYAPSPPEKISVSVTNNNTIEISNVYEIAQDFINENVDHLHIPEFTIKSPTQPKNLDRSGVKIRTYDNLCKKALRLIQTNRSLACDAGMSDEENDNENPIITEISEHVKKIEYYKKVLVELQEEVKK